MAGLASRGDRRSRRSPRDAALSATWDAWSFEWFLGSGRWWRQWSHSAEPGTPKPSITRIVIGKDGISFTGMGHLGARRAYPWSRVRAVHRTFLPTGDPALGLVIDPDPPHDRVVLPLAWTTLAEAELVAAMRRLAAPNTFEGP